MSEAAAGFRGWWDSSVSDWKLAVGSEDQQDSAAGSRGQLESSVGDKKLVAGSGSISIPKASLFIDVNVFLVLAK